MENGFFVCVVFERGGGGECWRVFVCLLLFFVLFWRVVFERGDCWRGGVVVLCVCFGGGGCVLFVFVFEGKSVGECFFVCFCFVFCMRHLILLTPSEGLDQKLLTLPLLASVLVSAQNASG